MATIETLTEIQTLSHRLEEGAIAAPEALRYAVLLANALRRRHDAGEVHGALTPAVVVMNDSGIEVLGRDDSGDAVSYTAPEVRQGAAPDACSDIYSFGAILYEMLTGRQAFPQKGPALVPSGKPTIDRLIARCVSQDPSARFQCFQKLVLELKMAQIAQQRAEAPARQEPEDPIPGVRAAIRELEAHLLEEIRSCKNAVIDTKERIDQIEQATTDAIADVETNVHSRLETLEQMAAAITNERMLNVEQTTVVYCDRVEHTERVLDSLLRDTATLRETVSEDLSSLNSALKAQSSSIETARQGLVQTDDVVERIVEALESLQCAVLQQSEKH